MIKAIIFDYGGVIGNDPGRKIYTKVSRDFKISPDEIKSNFIKFIFQIEKSQMPEDTFWRKLAKNLNISNHEILKRVWMGEYQKHARVNRELLNLIKSLKKRYALCLLSNNASFYRKRSIEKELKRHFNYIIYSFDLGMRKPERRIYAYLLKKIRVKPEECLVVDDNKKMLLLPKRMGMKTIRFVSVPKLRRSLNAKLNN